MTLNSLMESLRDWIEADLKEIRLPAKPEEEGQAREQSIQVFEPAMPLDTDMERVVPFILLQLINGNDAWSSSKGETCTATIRAVICVYDLDPQQGKRTLLGIVEKLRFDLEQAGAIGPHELKRPFEYLIYPDDTDYYRMAELSMTWSVPAVRRDVVKQLQGW